MSVRIVDVREITKPISSPIRNAYIDFTKMTTSLVAVVTDVVRDGKRVVGYGFNSNGRYGQGGLIRERFASRILEADPKSLLDAAGDNLDPDKVWAAMMTNEKPGGHGERSVAVGTIDMAVAFGGCCRHCERSEAIQSATAERFWIASSQGLLAMTRRECRRDLFLIPEIRLHRPVHLDGQRVAVAVLGIAGGDADPAFADAVLLDIGLLDALEADADIARQDVRVVIGAVRIDRQAVRKFVAHDCLAHNRVSI